MSILFQQDAFTLRRKVLQLFGASFEVFVGDQPVGFCRQKAFKLREDIRVFEDEGCTRPLIEIRARNIIDFSAAYDVVDSQDGTTVGIARRKGMSSLLRDSWELLDPQERVVARLQEDNPKLALVRRFLTNLVPQSFDLIGDGGHLAELKQRFNPFVYRLDVEIASDSPLDRRLVFGLAILIAAIEGRQSN